VCDRPAGRLVDVVFSNSALEHVPPPVIRRCFTEARRVLRAGGVMFHSVNCGDHYAYVDGRVHQLNYLQFSDADWRVWNNKFLYQNRLRAVDFVDMANAAGFTIELDTSRPHPTRRQQLDSIRVHPQFARYSPEQLAITSIDFVARNP
jgi:SAM-dependent methyltransferase